jgi:hypothetical protein
MTSEHTFIVVLFAEEGKTVLEADDSGFVP